MSESPPNILVVDDDPEIRSLMARHLEKHGLKALTAADGSELLRKLEQHHVDLIVLDLMMPGEDGLSLCRRLRQESRIPIIMLTAMDDDADRILGLELGADDYVTKPFNPRELVARIRAVLRRIDERLPVHSIEGDRVYTFAGWTLHSGRRELTDADDTLMPLTGGEFDLLLALLRHPQRVLTREQLLDLTKGREAAPFDRSIDVLLSRLRRKIEQDPKEPRLIKTVRGGGYLLAVEVSAATGAGHP